MSSFLVAGINKWLRVSISLCKQLAVAEKPNRRLSGDIWAPSVRTSRRHVTQNINLDFEIKHSSQAKEHYLGVFPR